jgi:hypothetical protein
MGHYHLATLIAGTRSRLPRCGRPADRTSCKCLAERAQDRAVWRRGIRRGSTEEGKNKNPKKAMRMESIFEGRRSFRAQRVSRVSPAIDGDTQRIEGRPQRGQRAAENGPPAQPLIGNNGRDQADKQRARDGGTRSTARPRRGRMRSRPSRRGSPPVLKRNGDTGARRIVAFLPTNQCEARAMLQIVSEAVESQDFPALVSAAIRDLA